MNKNVSAKSPTTFTKSDTVAVNRFDFNKYKTSPAFVSGFLLTLIDAPIDVCFTPNSDRESDFSQKLMSALTPKSGRVRRTPRCRLRANNGHYFIRSPRRRAPISMVESKGQASWRSSG